jgi:hypothetical protein
MTVNYTTLLALGQPVTGTESGTWGDDVNNAVTSYLDIAIAGTQTLSTDADVTLTLTQGTSSATNISSTSAQYMILNCTGSRSQLRYINTPNSSKAYIVMNNTTGGFDITIRGSTGPTTGITVAPGKQTWVAWDTNLGDFREIASGDVDGPSSSTDNAIARFDGTTGKVIQNSAATIADTTGDITAGAYNKVTITAPASSATLTIADGKTLTASNSLTLAGTDSTTMTFPGTSATIARTDAAQTFTGTQTFSGEVTMSATTDNIALGTSQTSGTWTAGGAAQTGTITLDQSTKTHTLAIGTGATESSLTKTINIGTGGVSTSTTAITIGSTNGTTITLNGTVNATTLNLTTLDLTNLEVTNIKAKDGTAAASIADITGVMTVSQAPVMSALTASQAVFTDGSKGLVSNAITGTGNVVMSGSPTLTGTVAGASLQLSSLTSSRVTYAGTSGLLQDSANLTFNGTDLTVSGAVNATTFDMTNLEVTNIKAKDGTAAASIADSTGIITVTTQLNVDNLNLSGNTLSSTDANGNIVLAPNGTGDVQVDADTLRVGDSGAAATITTNGAGNLTLSTNEGTNSGTIVINQGTNGNIEVAPNGTGDVHLTADTVRIGDSNANATLTTNGTGDLILNTNSGTNSGSITIADGVDGDMTLTPNGNGSVVITNTGTSNALRITQTGTGNALVVEDSANPDASPFVVTADGNVLVNATNSVSGLSGIQSQVQINNSAGIAAAFVRYSSDNLAPSIQFLKSRNATYGSQTVVNIDDGLGTLRFVGSDGTNFLQAASITSAVDGTPGTNDMPGRLALSTTADGASSPTERVRINASGLTTVGYSAATGAALSTTVAAKLYSSNTTYTDGITAASGTVTHGTIVSFDNPAIAASNASVTYTNASTLYIDGAPSAGSNVTITNPYALYVAAGTVYFGGTVSAADPIVQQSDIGTGANEIPLNQYLGANAYVDTETPALNIGTGITTGTGTICKANGGLSGGIYRMTILIDLTGLNSGGTAGDIIGVNGTALPCYIAQLPAMTVLGGRMTCLETPAGGDTDIDLYSATEGTGVEDQAITALTETQIINAGTQSIGTVTYFAADPATNAYFYLVGQSTSNATYTAGRFLIEIFGVQ